MLVVPVNNDVYIRIKKIKKKNDVYITFGSKRRIMYTFGSKRRMMYTLHSDRKEEWCIHSDQKDQKSKRRMIYTLHSDWKEEWCIHSDQKDQKKKEKKEWCIHYIRIEKKNDVYIQIKKIKKKRTRKMMYTLHLDRKEKWCIHSDQKEEWYAYIYCEERKKESMSSASSKRGNPFVVVKTLNWCDH
jgi:hypothetical protein